MKLPDPQTQVMTIGVREFLSDTGKTAMELFKTVLDFYAIQPDKTKDGGNDKFFFSMKFNGAKMFVCANEVGGLTVMLPEEY